MELEGTVVNGAVVPDPGPRLPEGARVRLEVIADTPDDDWPDLTGENLPADHPMAPYDRATELALLRASIADETAGVPLRRAIEELSRKHDLDPLPPG